MRHFKVLCVGSAEKFYRGTEQHPTGKFKPIEGQTYTVVWEGKSVKGYMVYSLEEDPNNFTYGWFVELFIRVSSIDEKEFVRDYNTEKVLV